MLLYYCMVFHVQGIVLSLTFTNLHISTKLLRQLPFLSCERQREKKKKVPSFSTPILAQRERERSREEGRYEEGVNQKAGNPCWRVNASFSLRWFVFALLSLQMLGPFFSKDLRFFASTLISCSNSICEIEEPLCDLEHIAWLWSLIQFLLLTIWCWKDEMKKTYSFCQ